jgi:hypothetical protein
VLREGILLAGAMVIGGSCNAMTSPSNSQGHCQIVDGSRLPASSGGAAALCDAIDRAMARHAPGTSFTAKVTVKSPSRLAATLTVEGRELPEQNFATMDRDLDGKSFERFAEGLATEAVKARP